MFWYTIYSYRSLNKSFVATGLDIPSAFAMLAGLLLARSDGLLHALGGARRVGLHLGKVSSRRLVGDDHVVELVLGDDVDGVCVCRP
jgi:hypothetical protein